LHIRANNADALHLTEVNAGNCDVSGKHHMNVQLKRFMRQRNFMDRPAPFTNADVTAKATGL